MITFFTEHDKQQYRKVKQIVDFHTKNIEISQDQKEDLANSLYLSVRCQTSNLESQVNKQKTTISLALKAIDKIHNKNGIDR